MLRGLFALIVIVALFAGVYFLAKHGWTTGGPGCTQGQTAQYSGQVCP